MSGSVLKDVFVWVKLSVIVELHTVGSLTVSHLPAA